MAEIAVEAGDILTLKGWSNATATLRAIVNFRPTEWYRRIYQALSRTLVSGADVQAITLDVSLASSRAQGTANYAFTVDGVIDDAVINYTSSSALVRGQTYAQLLLQRSGTTLSAVAILAAGYVYGGNTNGGHLPSLNDIVEAGPGGGHGSQTNNTLAGPAAGADFANYTVPTGAVQRVKGFFAQLTTGAGAANREFSIQYFSATIRGGFVAGEIQTATLTVDYVGADGGISSSGVTSNLAGGVTLIGLGNLFLQAGINALQFKTYNIQAADQWGVGNLITEEWVIPN